MRTHGQVSDAVVRADVHREAVAEGVACEEDHEPAPVVGYGPWSPWWSVQMDGWR